MREKVFLSLAARLINDMPLDSIRLSASLCCRMPLAWKPPNSWRFFLTVGFGNG